jgi:hypothetical protein
MLDDVSLGDTISGPLTFPPLPSLSLYNVIDLKPYMNAPSFATFHEGWDPACELFPAPCFRWFEYEVYGLYANN